MINVPKAAGVEGLEPAFNLNFLSVQEMADQYMRLVGTPLPVVDHGMTILNNTQYAEMICDQKAWIPWQRGQQNAITLFVEFVPALSFAATGCTTDAWFFDICIPGWEMWSIGFQTGILYLTPPAGGWLNAGDQSARWRIGETNSILATGIPGANNTQIYMNGVALGSYWGIWGTTRRPETNFYVGRGYAGGNFTPINVRYTRFCYWSRTMLAPEALSYCV